jgi:Domain of unknown function (DUF1707)/Domain of unknown function (DUF4190)
MLETAGRAGGPMTDGSGFWASGAYGHEHLRASDADRERAIDVLKAGYAEGRLTWEELGSRQARAHAARTYRDLAAVTADLPAGPLGTLGPRMAVPAYPFPVARKTNRLAIASAIAACLPLFGTVPAIVMGHAARKQIRESHEGGAGLAAVGLGVGYLMAGLFILLMLVGSIR